MKEFLSLAAALSLLASTVAVAEARGSLRREGSRPPVFALPDIAGRAVSLASFLGPRRIVLLFSPAFAYLQSVKEHRAQFEERDLTVLTVVPPGSPLSGEYRDAMRVLLDAEGQVAREYGAGDGHFAFYLIGKDGHIKMARRVAPTAQELFGVIDSMPMRQQEMRERRR